MKIKRITILEDRDIFKGMKVAHVARDLGMDRSYISRIKNGRIVASEKLYWRIKESVDKIRNVV